MKIAVLIRNVVDCRVPLPADADNRPLPEGMIHIINPPDWFALKQCLGNYKEKAPVVTAISLGDKEAEESLRRCLAAGAQQALKIWDGALAGSDLPGKGRALAAALKELKPDVVFCGDGCLDQTDTLLPGVVAAAAKMIYVSGILALEEFVDGMVVAVRRTGKGSREKLLIRLPALLALEVVRGYAADEASLPDLISAFSRPLPCRDLVSLGLSAERCGSRGAKVHPVITRVSVPVIVRPATPDSSLPAEHRLKTILDGGREERRGEVAAGSPEQMAERILRFLGKKPVAAS